jgi:hypothetical protein
MKSDMDYKQTWTEIDSLQKLSLPGSMLTKVNEVYEAALNDKDYPQLIKAIIFQSNCIGLL